MPLTGTVGNQASFLTLESRFARWKGSTRRRQTRRQSLHPLEGSFSLLDRNNSRAIISTDTITVVSPFPVEDDLSVCWNPSIIPSTNLSEFAIKIGNARGYGMLSTCAHSSLLVSMLLHPGIFCSHKICMNGRPNIDCLCL